MKQPAVTLVFPARAEYLVLARLALTGLARLGSAPNEETLADLRLAVTEAAANACRHAYTDQHVGDVTMHLELAGDGRLRVVVEDDGPGFDADNVRPWRADELDEDGMGLAIIQSVADDVEIGSRSDGTGTVIRFSRLLR